MALPERCVLWDKALDAQGYGAVSVAGKIEKAHRVAYCRHHDIDLLYIKGQVVRHKCDNPACVNPEHLELGTQADNVRDMMERGRHGSTKGTVHAKSLSLEDRAYCVANYIPRHPEFGAAALARRFGVTPQNIHFHIRRSKHGIA